MIAPWQESNDKPRQCIEKQRHYSADRGLNNQGYGIPSDFPGGSDGKESTFKMRDL